VHGAGFIEDSWTVACRSISMPPKVFFTGDGRGVELGPQLRRTVVEGRTRS
jgi:hypothetical protein